jgi:hypothetical protein
MRKTELSVNQRKQELTKAINDFKLMPVSNDLIKQYERQLIEVSNQIVIEQEKKREFKAYMEKIKIEE